MPLLLENEVNSLAAESLQTMQSRSRGSAGMGAPAARAALLQKTFYSFT